MNNSIPLSMGSIKFNSAEIAHIISEKIGDWLNNNRGIFPKRILVSDYIYTLINSDAKVKNIKMGSIRAMEQTKTQFMGIAIYSCSNVQDDFFEIS